MLLGGGGIGPVELWLSLGSVVLPGLGGTLLGYLGLNEIRESGGRLRGLPLAVFATLTWPLIILTGIIVGGPMFVLVPAIKPTVGNTIGRLFVLLLPAGVITFSLWAIHATIRWAGRQPVLRKRGMLKWVFLILFLVGIGIMMVTRSAVDSPEVRRPEPIVTSVAATPETDASPQPIRANFRAAKGQVVVLEVLRREQDPPVPVASFVGYAVAPDDERARFSLLLTPTKPFGSQTNSPAWRLSLVTEDGAQIIGSTEDFGDLISHLPTNHLHSIEPDSSFEIILTRPYPGAETNGLTPRPLLSLGVVSQARGQIGGPQAATAISLGSTNWVESLKQRQAVKPSPRPRPGEVLAYQWLKSSVGTNTTNTIRFTFTSVELRNEGGKQWLEMDYATEVRGDCEEVFRVDGKGFVTRKSALLVTPPDATAVRHQRFEVQIPREVEPSIVAGLRNEFASALVGKSFLVPEGEQRPLLRMPVGNDRDISVAIGAKLRDTIR